jgi:predicted RNA binding protein with dsRBD fold (UPF0201 family)
LLPELPVAVTVEAEVSPSEDPDKVVAAVRNVVSGDEGVLRVWERRVKLTSEGLGSLKHLRDQLRDRHVRSAARRRLVVSRKAHEATLMMNRQAAVVGALVVCGSAEESPLGPIYVNIRSRRLDEVLDWLTAYEEG